MHGPDFRGLRIRASLEVGVLHQRPLCHHPKKRHMPRRQLLLAVSLCLTVACSDAGVVTPTVAAPAVASQNGVIAVTVGTQVNYDASKGGTTFTGGTPVSGDRRGGQAATALQYQITFEGDANGLSANGPVLSGQPTNSEVTWATVTATDATGRTASDRFVVVAFAAGLPTPSLPATPFHYADAFVQLPAHFRATIDGTSVISGDNTPVGNPTTDAGAALGRVLFYDMRVSALDGLSCAGCHSPFVGFTDTPQFSVGFAGWGTQNRGE